jgi:hypothetical protein
MNPVTDLFGGALCAVAAGMIVYCLLWAIATKSSVKSRDGIILTVNDWRQKRRETVIGWLSPFLAAAAGAITLALCLSPLMHTTQSLLVGTGGGIAIASLLYSLRFFLNR